MKRSPRTNVSEIIGYVVEMLKIVKYIHVLDVLHADIKIDNWMLVQWTSGRNGRNGANGVYNNSNGSNNVNNANNVNNSNNLNIANNSDGPTP